MTTPYEWLKMIGATESLRDIASKTGVSHATLSRQINDGGFLIDTTIRLARAYGVSPVGALVANGHLTAEEAGVDHVESALEAATDAQLVDQIAKRLGVTDFGTVFDLPVTEAVANVRPLRKRNVPAPEQTPLRGVAKKKSRDRGGDDGQG
ncbi:hypothetical protein ACI3KS_05345 [Microbacterium sp. ZW T5_45]|uniref:hypothetical protein n=1 Tax=Microbacterium sp. ZW T5_45 TaxID=3378080 RepID=UPI003852D7EC